MLLFAFMIVGRIIFLQFVKGDELKAKAISFTQDEFVIKAKRGDIRARDGRLLSTSVPYYDIYFDGGCSYISDRTFFDNIDAIAAGLSRIFPGKSTTEYRQLLHKARLKNRRYVLLKRNINYNELKKVKHLPIFKLGKNKGGLIVEQKNKRVAPFQDLALRTIGYLFENKEGDKVGIVGLEGAYDRQLRGVDGFTMKQKLSGNIWMPINDENQVDAKDGNDVVSTIDIDVQDVAQSALRAALDSSQAEHGCAVLMEVETGNILAIANIGKDEHGNYTENFNYAVGESTEPGSTFKTASLMVAMEDGYVEPTDSVDTQGGVVSFSGAKMKDSHEGGYGRVSVQHALEVSSNVGVSKVIVKSYRGKEDEFVKGIYNLRLNVPLGLEINGEGIPYIKDPSYKSWSGVSLPWMSIGYEVHLTPLQILTFYNAIANNGKMVKPRFISEIRSNDQVIERKETEVLQPSICSKSTLKKVRDMLEGVVLNGTASTVKNKNYSVAGKTGTCLLNYWDKSKPRKYQASFVGYFPADKPKFSCIVVINSPSKGSYYGGVVSGGVFREIADKIFSTTLEIQPDITEKLANVRAEAPPSLLGYKDDLQEIFDALEIPEDNKTTESDWAQAGRHDSAVVVKSKNIKDKVIPDVRGMGARDAVFLLENKGLRVVVQGQGMVRRQSIQPGNPAQRGQVIYIELS